eukprot:scaffold54116_cov19-Tisochrysis_lutea.AAC.1
MRRLVAKYQASFKDNSLTDTGVPSIGAGGSLSYITAQPAWKKAGPSTPEFFLPYSKSNVLPGP